MNIIIYLVSLAALLLLLYLFHRAIVRYFSLISFLFFGTSRVGVYLYFLFFLPGVIFHELAHLFTASILGVPTGRLTIFPEKTDEEEGWTLGQVSSAETDILRSSLIGLAPIILGAVSLGLIVNLGLGIKELSDLGRISLTWPILAFLYAILALTNTMFLSEEDRVSIWAFPSLLVILFFFIQALGLVGVIKTVENLFYQAVSPLILSFSLTALVDFLFILPLVISTEILLRLKG